MERRDLLGNSLVMRQLLEKAEQAAKSQASVLIEGESGTGKGLLAEYIHFMSLHHHGRLVKINCAAIPENLLEAELFGYEPGAFTGATKTKHGRVELSEGGTLFLDEIGIAPQSLQSKLLRFLQDGEFERLGSNKTLKVKTRFISATNTDLKKAILSGALREDLYYRINVIHIKVPPLRERKEDIPLLVARFANESALKNGRTPLQFSERVMEALCSYDWPGNVREVQNVMERLVVLSTGELIEERDLPSEISRVQSPSSSISIPIGMSLREVEVLLFRETLRAVDGNKKAAANLLGVHPRTISRFLDQR